MHDRHRVRYECDGDLGQQSNWFKGPIGYGRLPPDRVTPIIKLLFKIVKMGVAHISISPNIFFLSTAELAFGLAD
jgi:hypothetical protein